MTRPGLVRGLVGAGLLAAIVIALEPSAVVGQVRAFEPAWAIAALALGALQFAISAERWRQTSIRLGVPIRRRRALAEYWLAGFANQALPGGVLGDAGRAWRHSRASGRTAQAVHSVVLERASGQFAVVIVLAGVLLLTAPGRQLMAQVRTPTDSAAAAAAWIAATVALVAASIFSARRVARAPEWVRRFARDARQALLARRAWPRQLLLSLAAVAACCAMFACTGKMIGAAMPFTTLLAIAPLVLVSMLIPVSIAGWGLRELAAAGTWAALGLPASEGVAVSIAYGLLCLAASLPGAAVGAAAPAARQG